MLTLAQVYEDRAADWELSRGLSSWDTAPARRTWASGSSKACSSKSFPPSSVPLVNNVMHWGYGIVNGAQYGIVAGSLPEPRIPYGLPFGASVWASSYVVLPAAKLYEPIWKYDAKTLGNDLSGHLVYGVATATAFRLLSG